MTMVNYDETVKNITDKIIKKYSKDSLEMLGNPKFNDENTSFVSNDVVSMEAHNESYTNILKAYSEELEGNIRFKNKCKECFFYLCVGVMGSICIALIAVLGTITYMTFKYQHLTFQINNIVAVVAAIGTAFVSSFFIIPKIITKYLFNRKEEENMMNIIQNIQKHDLTIRQDIKDFRQNNNSADF